jgi:hypothetical protein
MIIDDQPFKGELLYPELALTQLISPPAGVPSGSHAALTEGASRMVIEWHTQAAFENRFTLVQSGVPVEAAREDAAPAGA